MRSFDSPVGGRTSSLLASRLFPRWTEIGALSPAAEGGGRESAGSDLPVRGIQWPQSGRSRERRSPTPTLVPRPIPDARAEGCDPGKGRLGLAADHRETRFLRVGRLRVQHQRRSVDAFDRRSAAHQGDLAPSISRGTLTRARTRTPAGRVATPRDSKIPQPVVRKSLVPNSLRHFPRGDGRRRGEKPEGGGRHFKRKADFYGFF